MFGLMYLNTYASDHVFWSEMRVWMALLMGTMMAIIMLGYMLGYMHGMYKKRKLNIAIFTGSVVVLGLALWVVRSQATINEVDYMRAMIPHHSIAILTSSRAQISDPRVRKLADEIIASQRREIAEMKYLIHRIETDGKVDALQESETSPHLVPVREAINSAKIAETDLAELDGAEVERVLGRGPRSEFAYSRTAGPVIAASFPAAGTVARGVVKLHGRLVELAARFDSADPTPAGGLELTADGIQVSVAPASGDGPAAAGDDPREALAHLALEAGLEVGYGGFYSCTGEGRRALQSRN